MEGGHYTVKEHCPSDEKLNRGPDSLWSQKKDKFAQWLLFIMDS